MHKYTIVLTIALCISATITQAMEHPKTESSEQKKTSDEHFQLSLMEAVMGGKFDYSDKVVVQFPHHDDDKYRVYRRLWETAFDTYDTLCKQAKLVPDKIQSEALWYESIRTSPDTPHDRPKEVLLDIQLRRFKLFLADTVDSELLKQGHKDHDNLIQSMETYRNYWPAFFDFTFQSSEEDEIARKNDQAIQWLGWQAAKEHLKLAFANKDSDYIIRASKKLREYTFTPLNQYIAYVERAILEDRSRKTNDTIEHPIEASEIEVPEKMNTDDN